MEDKTLFIDAVEFDRNYNINFTPFVDKKGKFDYLQWGIAYKLLKQYHPSFEVRLANFYEHEPFFKVDHYLDLQVDKEELNLEITNQKLSGGGYYILPYIYDTLTKTQTDTHFFPVMDYSNSPVILPTSRDLNDNIQRGIVRTIAVKTGIGLRLYTQEDVSVGKNRTQKFQLLEKIYPFVEGCKSRGLYDFGTNEPNFGWTIKQLAAMYEELVELVTVDNKK